MSERQLRIPDYIREIVQEPNWYDQLTRIRGRLLLGSMALSSAADLASETGSPKSRAKRLMVRIFEQLLEEGAVMLGEAGPNWDAERQPIDTLIIHHTSNTRPLRLSYLNALHLLTLYVPKYQDPGPEIALIGGTPIYSGHADEQARQVFYGYHWLVRADGSVDSLLPNAAIGWQAGNWDVNCRSVALCFDADLQNNQPTEAALHAAVEIISGCYPQVRPDKIIGHSDVIKTECPGGLFGRWGEELRALVAAQEA